MKILPMEIFLKNLNELETEKYIRKETTMAYIWINPVTAGMYAPEVLDRFLTSHGYKRFHTEKDWLTVVKEKYREAIHQTTHTVIDMRCPKIKELLIDYKLEPKYNINIPDIYPILIHCSQEASEREDLLKEEKIITTPCQALADMGNALELPKTSFVPWRQFLQSLGEEPDGIVPQESPIPPGFFTDLDVKSVSISGEEEIRDYFENFVPDQVQVAELLFCKNGCHNGDGIRGCAEIACSANGCCREDDTKQISSKSDISLSDEIKGNKS